MTSEPRDSTLRLRRPSRPEVLLCGILLLVVWISLREVSRGELFFNVDETQHAVAGLFICDFLRDLPLAHPVDYTFRYYAQYQSMSIGLWPPLFYFVEGVFFLVLGPSVETARLAVLPFALLAVLAWYRLALLLHNEWNAALSTSLLVLLPTMILFQQQVMLEMPTLAMCLAAGYFWVRYLQDGARRWLYLFALLAGLALLAKFSSLFLALFCLFSVIVLKRCERLCNPALLRAAGIVVLLAAPYYLLILGVSGSTITAHLSGSWRPQVGIVKALLFYPAALVQDLGWPLLLLSGLGMLLAPRLAKPEAARLMFAWILACYCFFTPIGSREGRYVFYWLPAFLFFAAVPFTSQYARPWLRRAAAVAALVVFALSLRAAWRYERPYLEGFAPLAHKLVMSAEPGVILYDGPIPGNLAFHLRAYDPERRFILLRKGLYVTQVQKAINYQELVTNREEIRDLLNRYGIRFIVVDEHVSLEWPIQRILRDYLQTPEFRLVQRFPVETNMPDWKNRTLLLYENLDVKPRTDPFLQVRVLSLGRDINVRFDDLLPPPYGKRQ